VTLSAEGDLVGARATFLGALLAAVQGALVLTIKASRDNRIADASESDDYAAFAWRR